MEVTNRQLLQSGIEPVDKLLGGLEPHQLYLAHGDAAGKSLFGFKFLIEGLKRGEAGALVARYTPEDAVRRFARLGYDCLEDVKQNRLVILEYNDDLVTQIAQLDELTPVLRELEWWLRDAQPRRIIFDPVMPLIVGDIANLPARVQEFTRWAASFDATVLMVGNGEHKEWLRELQPLVRESFRFDFRENGDTATRYFTFEKTSHIPEQAIEVDPRRGVFLLQRPTLEFFSPLPPAESEEKPSIKSLRVQELGSLGIEQINSLTPELSNYDAADPPPALQNIFFPVEIDEEPQNAEPQPPDSELAAAGNRSAKGQASSVVPFPLKATKDSLPIAPLNAADSAASETQFVSVDLTASEAQPTPGEPLAGLFADFPDFLQQIEETISAMQLDEDGFDSLDNTADAAEKLPEQPAPEVVQPTAEEAFIERHKTIIPYGRRVSDRLHRQEAPATERRGSVAVDLRLKSPTAQPAINPKDFTVLIISEDALLGAQIEQALKDYSITTAHDALQGIANAMSLNPDLVILDVDIPMMDGFKVLAQIRACVNAPIITLSESRLRASDRILSAELGADYYLLKPLSLVEMKQKVRQLIARYRGINTWISGSAILHKTLEEIRYQRESQRYRTTAKGSEAGKEQLASYHHFITEVETRVKTAIGQGVSFSIVGFNLDSIEQQTGMLMMEIFDAVSRMVRNDDLLTRNPRNELVALLNDTDTNGAKAFITRLRQKLARHTDHDLPLWVRSFPSLEEELATVGAAASS